MAFYFLTSNFFIWKTGHGTLWGKGVARAEEMERNHRAAYSMVWQCSFTFFMGTEMKQSKILKVLHVFSLGIRGALHSGIQKK